MRLTKTILLRALLPTLALALAMMFAPTPPADRGSVASADSATVVKTTTLPAENNEAPDLFAYAWNQARDMWLAAWGKSAAA